MKTQYYAAATLDGFIATSDDSLEWLLQFGDPPEGSYSAFIREVGALAMGSVTYTWLLQHNVDANGGPKPWPYRQPVWVFSTRTLPVVSGAEVHFVRGPVAPVHRAMRAAAAGRNVWIVGGGELAGQFYDAGLLDEIIVHVAPVLLGSGKPLLPRVLTRPLRLLGAQPAGGTFAELRYAVPTTHPATPP